MKNFYVDDSYKNDWKVGDLVCLTSSGTVIKGNNDDLRLGEIIKEHLTSDNRIAVCVKLSRKSKKDF